ncbi:MAG: ABC transporter permease, partial [Erysipelothrix sp.]|nr:ABC transporter permease [Erysipelothrix sp.]
MSLSTAIFEHLQITFLGVLMGLIVGVIVATLMNRNQIFKQIVFVMIEVIQTIPTLAMFTFVMLVFWLNDTTVIVSV